MKRILIRKRVIGSILFLSLPILTSCAAAIKSAPGIIGGAVATADIEEERGFFTIEDHKETVLQHEEDEPTVESQDNSGVTISE